MVEVLGRSTNWEMRMRAVKRGIITAMGYAPEFTSVYVSEDIAEVIKQDTKIIATVGTDTTFESVPLKVNTALPSTTVIYIWKEK